MEQSLGDQNMTSRVASKLKHDLQLSNGRKRKRSMPMNETSRKGLRTCINSSVTASHWVDLSTDAPLESRPPQDSGTNHRLSTSPLFLHKSRLAKGPVLRGASGGLRGPWWVRMEPGSALGQVHG